MEFFLDCLNRNNTLEPDCVNESMTVLIGAASAVGCLLLCAGCAIPISIVLCCYNNPCDKKSESGNMYQEHTGGDGCCCFRI